MSRRIVIEEKCDHGVGGTGVCNSMVCDHPKRPHHLPFALECWCPGGSRILLDGPSDEMVKRAADAIYALDWGYHPPQMNGAVFAKAKEQARAALSAALGGGNPI